MVKYVGWGDSAIANQMFPSKGEPTGTWKELRAQLESLLTKDEMKTAMQSTQYAHYTSKSVIDAIYQGVKRLGVKDGKAYEGGIGIGHFIGLIPSDMNLQYAGIELDGISADIAKALYPQAGVMKGDFTKTGLPENYYDLTIGNPPFADITIKSDPRYRTNKFRLHDYFIAKQIDAVKPGGIGVFITSKGTMDKRDDSARSYLARRANLLGAIRLPQTAFKANAGTEVVTDILFFQKEGPGVPLDTTQWMGQKEIKTKEGPAVINEYFADHPEMILGESSLTGSMYGANEYTVIPTGDIVTQLAEAVARLPAGVATVRATPDQLAEKAESVDIVADKMDGTYYLDNRGVLRQVDGGLGKVVPVKGGGQMGGFSKAQAEIVRDYIPLRDAVLDVYKNQANPDALKQAQKAMSRTYDAFVKKHGPIRQSVTRVLKNGQERTTEPVIGTLDLDPSLFRIAAIEDYDEVTNTATKKAIFTERVTSEKREVSIDNAIDALNVTLDHQGHVDMDYLVSL